MNQKIKICSVCGLQNNSQYKDKCKSCYQKEYRENNKELLKKYYHNYNQCRRKEQKLYNAEYRKTHNLKKYWAKRNKKIKSNPVLKYKSDIRKHLNNCIKRKHFAIIKGKHTEEILGCSFEEFKIYIEKQFWPGMTWGNYGKWELDHIIPLRVANNLEEVYQLCHYTNYQPLWKLDNIKKGGTYDIKPKAE